MRCPVCGCGSDVKDSRPRDQGRVVRRKRRCVSPTCGHRWTTLEHEVEVATVYVPRAPRRLPGGPRKYAGPGPDVPAR